ncbi:hypothetical protein NQ318_017348 [Aromia moschata]|uniref:Adenosine 5'-monophosphoramidase HINT3 n=1 Tax=Aromia moschata TaxID=1265417 RepID=A0AAV8XC73_9CUCU|nr:hypothetical protein NQ318_017348 [Aromia moschata]
MVTPQEKYFFQDDEIIVFKDIKPASKHHYLSVPKQHISNVTYLTSDHKELLDKLIQCGKKVLADNGGDTNNIRLGFHKPPFNSIDHLHLHIISPASEMSFLSGLIFRPNTWWFQALVIYWTLEMGSSERTSSIELFS